MNNSSSVSNKERLASLSSADFYSEVSALINHRLSKYIDYEAYFDSSDANLIHFLRSKGMCYATPSETQIQAARNEGTLINEEWLKANTKNYEVLDFCKIYDNDYVTVADIENEQILKVPLGSIILPDKREPV